MAGQFRVRGRNQTRKEGEMATEARATVLCLLLVTAMFISLCFSTVSQAAEPVKIGYLVSLSGVYATLGEDLRDGLKPLYGANLPIRPAVVISKLLQRTSAARL